MSYLHTTHKWTVRSISRTLKDDTSRTIELECPSCRRGDKGLAWGYRLTYYQPLKQRKPDS